MAGRLVGIDHVQLSMPSGPDAEASAERFYVDLLGLTSVPKPPVLAARGGRWFENECVRLHLGVEAEFRAAKRAHPALMVDGLDELVANAESMGHSVRWDDELPQQRRCYIDDPFGNRIELIDVVGQ